MNKIRVFALKKPKKIFACGGLLLFFLFQNPKIWVCFYYLQLFWQKSEFALIILTLSLRMRLDSQSRQSGIKTVFFRKKCDFCIFASSKTRRLFRVGRRATPESNVLASCVILTKKSVRKIFFINMKKISTSKHILKNRKNPKIQKKIKN